MAGPEINDGSGQDLPGNLEFERNFEIIRNLILENVETDYQLSTLDANSPGVSSVVKFMEIEDCEKLLSELSTYAQTSIKTELMGIATKVLEQNGIIIAFEEIWENGN